MQEKKLYSDGVYRLEKPHNQKDWEAIRKIVAGWHEEELELLRLHNKEMKEMLQKAEKAFATTN